MWLLLLGKFIFYNVTFCKSIIIAHISDKNLTNEENLIIAQIVL